MGKQQQEDSAAVLKLNHTIHCLYIKQVIYKQEQLLDLLECTWKLQDALNRTSIPA